MTDPRESDFDRVMTRLRTMAEADGDPVERALALVDIEELEMFRKAWRETLINNPGRKGNPENLALMQWVGLSVGRRLPFVFNVLGLGHLAE